jgi:hypothetical protein
MRRPLRLLATLVATTALLPVAAAAADPYPVTSLSSGGPGSLREAIEDANDRAGGDTIPINVTGAIELEEALPTVEDDVTIVGPGASSLTVEPGSTNEFRIFDFDSGVTATLDGVTVTGGVAQEGAGIRGDSTNLTLIGVVVTGNEAVDISVDAGDDEAVAAGGGVLNSGPLTVRESVISDNSATATGGNQTNYALGAGLMAWDALTVDRSTISGNVAEADGEGGNQSGALGGGLRVIGKPAIVERSTIGANSVLAERGLTNEARGGGLQGNELRLISSTVTGNSLTSIGLAAGANLEFAGTTLVRNSILANASGDAASCSAPLTSGGFNLDEDGSCDLGAATDQAGFVAGLDPVLRENGGPTPTHALLAGSIAIDRGNSFGSTIDQRGFPRPVDFQTSSNTEGGDGSDIGAFELQAPPQASQPPPAPASQLRVSQVPGDRTPPQTRIVSGPARAGFERLAEFRFTSTEAQSRFQCKVDKRRWRGCSSPYERRVGAARGAGRKHVFKVRAIDRFGNADPTPARFGWRVKKIVG